MPFTQKEAEGSASVQSVLGTRGQLRLWQKGNEVMLEVYRQWGTLMGSITVLGLELEEAVSSLGSWS